MQRVNLTSVYLCCKYAIPHMQRQGKGSIINTASFVALMGAATSQIAYTASKGGVLAMTRELGVQFAREGIRVNALCPGPVATPLLMELFAKDPGAGRPAAGAHPDGPVRRAGGDRRRRDQQDLDHPAPQSADALLRGHPVHVPAQLAAAPGAACRASFLGRAGRPRRGRRRVGRPGRRRPS